MIRPIIGGMILSLLAVTPALAVGVSCTAQLDQINALLQQKPNANAALRAKYDEAVQLCKTHHDEQAQDMARQIKIALADAAKSGNSSSPAQPSR